MTARPSWTRFKQTLRLELARTRAALQPRALLAALRTRLRTARESFTAELGRGGEQPRDNHGGHRGHGAENNGMQVTKEDLEHEKRTMTDRKRRQGK